jgi:subtilisin family serine protease
MGTATGRTRAIARIAGPLVMSMLLALPAPAAAESPGAAESALRATDEVRVAGAASTGTKVPDLGRGPADAVRPSGRAYAEGVVLVQYRVGARAKERAAARAAVHATDHRQVSPLARGLERLTLAPGASVMAAVQALRGRGAVRFAEPDYYVTVEHNPGDDIYGQNLMWGMKVQLGGIYGSGANEAWATYEVGSRDVVVGILDTGVEIAHKDLVKNIWTNPFETPGNGVDDDGNGYVDDIHGWDFFHDDASLYDSEGADYHGTHVAGTVGAEGANSRGVVGVNWAVTMIPMKFIHGEGSTSDAVEALDYLTDLKVRHGLNIVASNNSWGGDEASQALEDAINRGGDADILFVAAAGNDGLDIDEVPTYPASHECDTRFDNDDPRGFDCLISVAAITKTGGIADFSNYGSTSVDIGAPGQEIASTYPGNAYVYLDGTSMATPHVTGAIALLASCRSASTSELLRASVIDNGVPTGSLNGLISTGDRLSIGPMMAGCDLGGPRVWLTTQAGGTDTPTTVGVWFSEPVSGLDVSDFTIGGSSSGWAIDELVMPFVPAGVGGLNLSATSPPAGTLTVTLAADSVTGDGGTGPAAPVSITIVVDRAAPTATAPAANISDIDGLSGQQIPVLLTWGGSDSGSGVQYYYVQYSRNGGAWTDLVTEWRFTSLTAYVAPSGTIRFRVGAVDFANHASAWTPGPTFSPRLVQEGAGAIDYGGSWALGSSSSYSDGKVRYTSTGKRSATFKFTGRAVGLITTMTPNRGVVKIKLDGDLVAIVDMSWPQTLYRQVIWSRKFASANAHTVKVIVVGGQGRVDIDAFAVLK